MTPEKRLDQLEPLMAEMLQKQDNYLGQIRFLAMNILDLAGKQSQTNIRLDKIESRLDKIESRLDNSDAKLDLILNILRSKNGH
jgi:chromosome segregation ATPase